ncbi:MAG: NfeD family protein [Christensenellales bacterium]|jgi:membrane-bound ClpP family serine protease
MAFILNNLPILICAVIGIALIIVEMFMPGFGIPGISGIILLIGATALTWTQYGYMAGLGVGLILLVIVGVTIYLSIKSATKGRLSRSALILKGAQSREDGFVATEENEKYLHKEGVTLTVLRPAGLAEIEGDRVNVVSMGNFVEQGVRVRVREVEGSRVLVEKVEA